MAESLIILVGIAVVGLITLIALLAALVLLLICEIRKFLWIWRRGMSNALLSEVENVKSDAEREKREKSRKERQMAGQTTKQKRYQSMGPQ